jgi:hypothetical protein
VLDDVRFGTLDQRADDLEAAVVGGVLGRHRLQAAGVEQVHQQRLDRVVTVVTERDLVAAIRAATLEDATAVNSAQNALPRR